MIFSSVSNYMLKYQKAKAKLVEYDIPYAEYPHFPLNSNELSYPIIYILSRYAESIIENNEEDKSEFAILLTKVSQYFDAAVGAADRTLYDSDFLLSGASAYFLSNDYGSAKVLSSSYFERICLETTVSQKMLSNLMGYLLLDRTFEVITDTPVSEKLSNALLLYFQFGKVEDQIRNMLCEYRTFTYKNDNSLDIYYADLLYAICLTYLAYSSWKLLPEYSKLDQSIWEEYLKKEKAMKMLWPAQQLIGAEGLLYGKSAIIQLPTGVGKTKSIELIIRASFESKRSKTAIIVAPLRSLCNEIASDMIAAFKNDAIINQFSDSLIDDFSYDLSMILKPKILICTPEKLSYIIHHQTDFLLEIGLFIFDEGHMFDDGSRGANYELLIAQIKTQISREQQIIVLSAVLSNAEQIREWLLDNEGILASDPQIQATPKSIGFSSASTDLHYYSSGSDQEDFYLPRSIHVIELKKKPRERKKRYFPDLTNAKDIAIYYADKLCKNGGVAIFANRVDSIQTIIKRILELSERGYDFSKIKAHSNVDELNKLARLFAEYYGEDYIYTRACKMGVVPHYSKLANGIRLAIESAFRSEKVCFICCTSTLAQGVNIPIKYLFMTSFMVAHNSMQIRNFQNLMGRTARSGMYTEGSIIVTDPKLYDKQNDKLHGGYYKWNDCLRMFDKNSTEPCSSSILMLVQELVIDYKASLSGSKITQFIIEHIENLNCFEDLTLQITKAYLSAYPENINNNIAASIAIRKKSVETIENYLCFAFANNESCDKQSLASDICHSTLAFFMANDAEKALLESLFSAIALKVTRLDTTLIKNYSKTMIGIDLAKKIRIWIQEAYIIQKSYTDEQLLDQVLSFFMETHTIKKATSWFTEICKMWIGGVSFNDMEEQVNVCIADIEDVCINTLSFDLSFFIGNIIDLIDINDENCVNPIPQLLLMQKRVKYGVNDETAASICERVFNDRFISNLISNFIGKESIDSSHIIDVIKLLKDDILTQIAIYPSFFSDRIEWICRG